MNTYKTNQLLYNILLALGRRIFPERFKSSGRRVLDCLNHLMAKSRMWHGVIRVSPQSAAQPPCVNPMISSLMLENRATKLHGSQKANPMLNQLFEDHHIIRILSKMRAKIANSRSKKEFNKRLCSNKIKRKSKAPDGKPDEISELLPPRKVWELYRIKNRRGKSTQSVNAAAIERATIHRIANPGKNDHKWIGKFHDFTSQLRHRALHDPDFEFRKPKISPIPKDKDGNHRAIAIYHLEDRIISSQLTRYLRQRFDDQLSESSYAFREPKNGRCKSHHDAIDHIYAFREKHPEGDLWVAECDIRGFFDCLHHDVVRQAFSEFASKAGQPVEPRAKEIFLAYLESYTFPKNVLMEALPRLQSKKPNAKIKWPLDALEKFYDEPKIEPIGVPQGGAISGLIANIVLDQVDRAGLSKIASDYNKLYYSRYCDDMIVMSPDAKLLKSFFSQYIRELIILKLPVHEPEVFGTYDKKFLEIKSKAPYRWRYDPTAIGSSPWIAFVGYQIRCDGVIRIRLGSVKKHYQKIVAMTDKLLRTLFKKSPDGVRKANPGILVSGRQALYRLMCQLISSSVGRPRINEPGSSQNRGPCWLEGFRALFGKNVDLGQMRRFDRHRGRELARVSSILTTLPKIGMSPSAKPKVRYHGGPFSYYGQFRKKPEN